MNADEEVTSIGVVLANYVRTVPGLENAVVCQYPYSDFCDVVMDANTMGAVEVDPEPGAKGVATVVFGINWKLGPDGVAVDVLVDNGAGKWIVEALTEPVDTADCCVCVETDPKLLKEV